MHRRFEGKSDGDGASPQPRAVYTYTGILLLALNPFEPLPLYGTDQMRPYVGRPLGGVAPHTYGQATWKAATFELQTDGMLRWRSEEAWPWDAGAIDVKQALTAPLLPPNCPFTAAYCLATAPTLPWTSSRRWGYGCSVRLAGGDSTLSCPSTGGLSPPRTTR